MSRQTTLPVAAPACAPDQPGQAVTIVVHGQPAPQGSKRAIIHKSSGKAVMMESSATRLRPWRADVKAAAEAVIGCRCGEDCGALMPGLPLDGAVGVSTVFSFRRPRSHWRTGRNAHLLRDGAPPRPHHKPDLSHLMRSTEDALTDAGLWVDDARIVEYGRLAKVWVGEDPQALDVPGARIVVWPWQEESGTRRSEDGTRPPDAGER